MPETARQERGTVRVLRAWDETKHLRALEIELPEPRETHPGQVLKLHTDAGDGFFALANSPLSGRPSELLIKRGGVVADEVLRVAEPGAFIAATPPFGAGFPVKEAKGRDVLLLAAGAGIAPIRALVEHLASAREDYGAVLLYYGQRHADEFAYAHDYGRWRAARIDVILCASRPEGAWETEGHVQDVAVRENLRGLKPERTVVFLCGGKPMIQESRETLAKIGIDLDRTFLNY